MHFLCIVYGEDIDGGHLEQSCGITGRQFTLPGPVDQPEVKKPITRTIKQLNAGGIIQKGYSSHYPYTKPPPLFV